jgi:hypothetical protein
MSPAGRTVSDKCQAHVADYKVERSKHINRDVALGETRLYPAKGRGAAIAAATAAEAGDLQLQ